jgi:hypothetical protein
MKWLTRDRRTDHFSECFLTDLRKNWLRSAFLSKIGSSKSRE